MAALARYGEAESLLKRAVDLNERHLGPNHYEVATNLVNLADVAWAGARYLEAERLLRRAFTIYDVNRSQPPSVAISGLGLVYPELGRFSDSETMFREAVAMDHRPGANQAQLAKELSNLGIAYRAGASFGDAERVLTRSLAIGETALGRDHPDVGTKLNNLALLYTDLGRYRTPNVCRACNKHRGTNPRRSPSFAREPVRNMGLVYMQQGRYGDASPLSAALSRSPRTRWAVNIRTSP